MPFANARGIVTLILEHLADRETVARNHRSFPSPGDSLFPVGPPAVTPRQETVATGSAHRRRRMSIAKHEALGGQFVQIGSRDSGGGGQRLHISITKVIGQDENDVRSFGFGCRPATG